MCKHTCVSSNAFVHSVMYYSHFLPQDYTPKSLALCAYNITVPPHTEDWQIATIYPQDLHFLIAFPNSILPSMCIYSTTDVARCRDGEHVSRVSLMPENVNMDCWAWNGTPPCSWTFSTSWFFHAGTLVLRRHLAPSLHLYLFLWKTFLLPLHYISLPFEKRIIALSNNR